MPPSRKNAGKKGSAKKAAPSRSAPKAVKKAGSPKAATKRAAPAKKAGAPKASASKAGGLMSAAEMARAIDAMAKAIRREFPSPKGLLVLGIRTRGVVLAERLRAALEAAYKNPVASGVLDITLYRDDLSSLGAQPMVRDSEIPHDVTGTHVILVDDVLYTGRTIRAAMDEIIDYGRPAHIRLAVLVDRGCREYPIQADYVGRTVATTPGQVVRVAFREIDDRDEVVLKG